MPRPLAPACTWLALLACGCGAVSPRAVSHKPGSPAKVRSARHDCEYLLTGAEGTCAERVFCRQLVAVGDPVGFAWEGDTLVAVAGAARVPLGEGRYCWRSSPRESGWGVALASWRHFTDDTGQRLGLFFVLAGLAALLGVFIWALCDKNAVGVNLNGLGTR